MQYVHQECLLIWLRRRNISQYGKCEVCGFPYRIERANQSEMEHVYYFLMETYWFLVGVGGYIGSWAWGHSIIGLFVRWGVWIMYEIGLWLYYKQKGHPTTQNNNAMAPPKHPQDSYFIHMALIISVIVKAGLLMKVALVAYKYYSGPLPDSFLVAFPDGGASLTTLDIDQHVMVLPVVLAHSLFAPIFGPVVMAYFVLFDHVNHLPTALLALYYR